MVTVIPTLAYISLLPYSECFKINKEVRSLDVWKILKHQYKLHGQSENNILNVVTQVHFLSFISAMLGYRIAIVESEFSSQLQQRYFSFLPFPDRPWGPPSFLCNGYWVLSLRGKRMKQTITFIQSWGKGMPILRQLLPGLSPWRPRFDLSTDMWYFWWIKWTVIQFSPATSVLSYQYHSTNSPYSCFIYLPSTLYSPNKWQRC